MNKTLIVTLLSALFLSGCAGQQWDQSKAGPMPTDYKETVKQYVERTHFDPYSLRSVAITSPHPGGWMGQHGYWLCFERNAKNRMGGYVGIKRSALLIRGHEIVWDLDYNAKCNEIAYDLRPWPEMEMTGQK